MQLYHLLHKNDEKYLVCNYRRISVVSVICKIMESGGIIGNIRKKRVKVFDSMPKKILHKLNMVLLATYFIGLMTFSTKED